MQDLSFTSGALGRALDALGFGVLVTRFMAGGWALITQDLYDKLTIAFREAPGRFPHAARRALCAPATAKRAWLKGWPHKGLRPIQIVLEEEREAAAAAAREAARRQAEEEAAVRDAARREAIESQAQEKQMLKAARGDVLAALVIAAELVPSMRMLAKVIARACEPKPDGSPPDIPASTAMQLLTRHATLIQKAVGATEAVVQLSRLDRGAATVNVGFTAEDLTLEQAAEELEALEETLASARRNGLALPVKSTG